MVELDLAKQFDTSQTPVREALMLLEKEGLVEVPPRRRPRVARFSLNDIQEIYEIRSALNGLMMELFVVNADKDDLARAWSIFERMRAADTFFAERVRLQDVWMERCGNATLHRTLMAGLARMSLRRLGVGRAEDIHRSLLDHERLVIACEERDAQLAAALIRSMTLQGCEAIHRSSLPRVEGPRRRGSGLIADRTE